MQQKYISFVFDDGPKEPLCEIVDKISNFGWKASFAIVGKKINDDTEKQLRYAIEQGFELVSHGWNHIDLTTLNTKEEIENEILRPIYEVKNRLNYDVKMARLPFIGYNDLVMEVMTELKIPLLGQGIDGGDDWSKERTSDYIANAIINSASDGAIACLHVTQNTLKALDTVLPLLKGKEYELVTVEELLKMKNVTNPPYGINLTNVKRIK